MRISHKNLALTTAGVVAGVALGVTGLAGAASPSPSPSPGQAQPDLKQRFDRHGPGMGFGHRGMMGGYGGLVTAIDSDSLSLSTPRGSETVALDGSTTYYVGKTKATRSAIGKGDVVHVRVADPSATKKVATVVTLAPARLGGWVTKVDSDTITLTDHDGFTRTVRTSGSTTYLKDGASATRSAVTVGAMVMAVGKVDDNGTTLDADQVSVGMPKLGGHGFRDAPDAQQGSFPQA